MGKHGGLAGRSAFVWGDPTVQPSAALYVIIDLIIITFKGAIRDFDNLLTAPRTVSNTYAQVARAQSSANLVQHIERLTRARDTKGQLSC